MKFVRRWCLISFIFLLKFSYSLSSEKIICYYEKRSEDRTYAYRLLPEDIDPNLCTHILYSFEIPDVMQGFVPKDYLRTLTVEGGAEEFNNLRKLNPNLTLMLSVGGWQEGSLRFSKIVSNEPQTDWFIHYAAEFIRHIGFDGLDINWQWPGQREGGSMDDKKYFTELIKKMKSYFVKEAIEAGERQLLLSVVLPPFKEMVTRGFDTDIIIREADFVILMTMDYYGSTDYVINHHAPLYSVPFPFCDRDLTVDATVRHYLELGVDPEKMILGIPFYGHSYILEEEYMTSLGSHAEDEGSKGFGTKTSGTLAYFEICKYIQDYGWTVRHLNITALGPYAYHQKKWVAFDDEDIVKRKVNFAREKCLGGIMLWTLDMDDFKGICRTRFALANAAKNALINPEGSKCKKSVTQEEPTGLTSFTSQIPSVTNTINSTNQTNKKPFKMVTREKWQAEDSSEEIPKLRISPVPFVIIAHTTSSQCDNYEECKPQVQNIQHFHLNQDYGDIGYSFLVGGDGNIYEGRGWDLHGAHTLPFNGRSIGIAFLGNFALVKPPQKQVDAALRIMDEGVRIGKIKPDYKVFGQKQVIAIESPGSKLMEIIKTWPHYTTYDPIEDD